MSIIGAKITRHITCLTIFLATTTTVTEAVATETIPITITLRYHLMVAAAVYFK